MKKSILVVDANEDQRKELCALLEREDYSTADFPTLKNLGKHILENGCQVVLVDLDTLPVDNLFFKELKRKNPGVCIIGLSSRSFHPELEDAMSKYIHVCLGKPVDGDELFYWLRSICENNADSRDSPGT